MAHTDVTTGWLVALGLGCAGCTSTATPAHHTIDSSAEPSEAGATREFDLGLDFSFSSNPNGPWRYGYTVGTALTADQFVLDSFGVFADGAAEGFWHPNDAGGAYAPIANPSDGGGYYPYVAANPGTVTAVYQNAWAARAHEVAMEASNGGQYSVVEFVAPERGAYSMQVRFEGIHFQLSSTDVHVRRNDVELFTSNIDGYGGDPSAHPVEGSNAAAVYRGAVSLQANDVVLFAVGFGADKTNYNDTTGLFAHITWTPQ